MRNTLCFFKSIHVLNFKNNFYFRLTFFFHLLLMAGNNLALFTVWWIFFQRFQDLKGWSLTEVATLYSIVTGGCGFIVIFFGGFITLSRSIRDGELDFYLAQPKNVLLRVLCSKSPISGWGDLFSAFVFLLISGHTSWFNLLIMLILIFCSGFIFLSAAIMIHSLAFWSDSVDDLSRQLVDFISILSVNPQSTFTGFLRILVFSIFPAGFVGYLPVHLMKEFSWMGLFILVAITLIYSGFALFSFDRGLKRYKSIN